MRFPITVFILAFLLLPAETFGYLFRWDFDNQTKDGLIHNEISPPVNYSDSYPKDSSGGHFLRRHCQTNPGYSNDVSAIFEYVESADFENASFRMFADFRLSDFTSNEARFGLFSLLDFAAPGTAYSATLFYDGSDTKFDLCESVEADLTGTVFDIFEWFNLRLDVVYDSGGGPVSLFATLAQGSTGYYREFNTTGSALSGTSAGFYYLIDNTPYPPGSEFTVDVDNFGINPEPSTIVLMLISGASCLFMAHRRRNALH